MKASTLLMAFDFGLSNIGVAVGETGTGVSHPLTLVKAKDGEPDWPALATLIKEWRAKRLLVGLPLNMDGFESDMSRRARRFGLQLGVRFGLPVLGVDERLSTFEAEARTEPAQSDRPDRKEQSRKGPVRRTRLDDLAAQVILQSYLDNPESAVEIV